MQHDSRLKMANDVTSSPQGLESDLKHNMLRTSPPPPPFLKLIQNQRTLKGCWIILRILRLWILTQVFMRVMLTDRMLRLAVGGHAKPATSGEGRESSSALLHPPLCMNHLMVTFTLQCDWARAIRPAVALDVISNTGQVWLDWGGLVEWNASTV